MQQQFDPDGLISRHNLHGQQPTISNQRVVDQSPYLCSCLAANGAPNCVWPEKQSMPLSWSVSSMSHGGSHKFHVSDWAMADFRASPQQAQQNMNETSFSHIVGSPLQFQFPSGDCTETFAKIDGSIAKDFSGESSTSGFPQCSQPELSNQVLHYSYLVSKQDSEAKGLLASVLEDVLDTGSAAPGEYQQSNPFPKPLQPQRSEAMQIQNINVNAANCSGPSSASCIDHAEERTLCDTDGYSDRTISFGTSSTIGMAGCPYSSPLQSNNHCIDMRNGIWTTLMQEAMETSTSDNGLNEECSGLTFNDLELSGGNTLQHQVFWDSVTSNPLPFLGDMEANADSNIVSSLQNLVDLPQNVNDKEQDTLSSKLKVPPWKELTSRHLYRHQDQMQCVEWKTNSGRSPNGGCEELMNEWPRAIEEPAAMLPIAQDIHEIVAQPKFTSVVNWMDVPMDNGTKGVHGLYECEEQMQIDSLLTSFDASSDAFSQSYEMVQTSENIINLHQKVKLEENISATCFNTVPYTHPVVHETALSDGSPWLQQYQSIPQVSGLIHSSASQWTPTSSATLPLQACQQTFSEFDPNISSAAKSKDHLWPANNRNQVQQQQGISSGTKLELTGDAANHYLDCTVDLDDQFHPKRVHLYHDGEVEIQSARAKISSAVKYPFAVHSSTCTGHSDTQLLITETMPHVGPCASSLSKDFDSSFMGGTELKKTGPEIAVTWVEHTGTNRTPNRLVDNGVDHSQCTTILPHGSFEQNASENVYCTKTSEQSDDGTLTWVEHTGTNSTQNRPVDNGFDHSQCTTILPHGSFEQNASENVYCKKTAEQRDDGTQIVGPLQTILLSPSEPSASYGLPTYKFNDKVASRHKKRKRAKADLLGWHAKIMFGCRRAHSTSYRTPELDWACAANRLVEKVDCENASMKNSNSVDRAQKRLILTTRLTQYILPVLPARLLSTSVSNSYGSIVFYISRLALSDTFDLVLSFVSNICKCMESGSTCFNQTSTSGRGDGEILSEVLETFIARFGKLESHFSRVEKIPTVQELESELLDLERWSILHHFVKFHRYAKTGGGGTSNSQANPCGTTVQKHVRVAVTPQNLPDGIRCRSL